MASRTLETLTALELLERPLEAVTWVVEGLLAIGLTVLAGDPKTGKTWLAELLALCVSRGTPFLEHATQQAEVLYLCLEDTFARVQQRLFHLTDEANDSLHFAVSADGLQGGLLDQLGEFVSAHPATRLIVVDTFQLIRTVRNDNVYAGDYADVGSLKRFADDHQLAVLLVTHTRKASDPTNVFNRVSGSNGIMGAADETMVLAKTNFFDGEATLSVTGRDVDLAEYRLRFKDCRWELVERVSEEELQERLVPPSVMSVIDFMANRAGDWEGTASQLVDEARLEDVRPNVLTKLLNEHRGFLAEHGVAYRYRRTSSARLIKLVRPPAPDSRRQT